MLEIKNNIYYTYRLNFVSPKICWSPNPHYLWLWPYWNRIFADIIKLSCDRSGLGSNIGWYPYKRRRNTDLRHTEDSRLRHGQRLELCIHRPRNTWGFQKLREIRKDPPLETWSDHDSVNIFIPTFILQNHERISFCCFKPPSL